MIEFGELSKICMFCGKDKVTHWIEVNFEKHLDKGYRRLCCLKCMRKTLKENNVI